MFLSRLLLLCAVIASACVAQGPNQTFSPITSEDVWIYSRGVDVPLTFVSPQPRDVRSVPLVVLVHGHGGTRHEAGAFREVAMLLAINGIASVRMDFPGCGDSTEPFTSNNLTNMLWDVDAALRFGLEQPGIDVDRVGILGYSMGGRLAMLAAGDITSYSTVVLWAPAGTNGPDSMFSFFGGHDKYRALRSEAQTQGSALFVSPWGHRQYLGSRWFQDMEASQPLTSIAKFRGPLLILHGAGDKAIEPAVGEAVRDAAIKSASVYFDLVPEAGHGFGFYDDTPDVRAYVLAETVAFFRAQLVLVD